MANRTIYRRAGDPGPKHSCWPDINIAATAKEWGVSKWKLGRLLAGGARELSAGNLRLLAGVLGKSLEEVWDLYMVADWPQETKSKKRNTKGEK